MLKVLVHTITCTNCFWFFYCFLKVDIMITTVQSLHNTSHYNMDLDLTSQVVAPKCFTMNFYKEIIDRKMTIKWSLSYNSFVKSALFKMVHL